MQIDSQIARGLQMCNVIRPGILVFCGILVKILANGNICLVSSPLLFWRLPCYQRRHLFTTPDLCLLGRELFVFVCTSGSLWVVMCPPCSHWFAVIVNLHKEPRCIMACICRNTKEPVVCVADLFSEQ